MLDAYNIALDLNRALIKDRDKVTDFVFSAADYSNYESKGLVSEINDYLKSKGHGFKIIVVFSDKENTIIERFDIIDVDNDTQIVTDNNLDNWF